MSELITQGVNGFLVGDIGSAAQAVASAGELDRYEIAAIAGNRFSAATMIDKYVSVYRDVIRNRK